LHKRQADPPVPPAPEVLFRLESGREGGRFLDRIGDPQAQQDHGVMKHDLAGGELLSKSFGVNAV